MVISRASGRAHWFVVWLSQTPCLAARGSRASTTYTDVLNRTRNIVIPFCLRTRCAGAIGSFELVGWG